MDILASVLVDLMVLTLQLSNPAQATDYTEKTIYTMSTPHTNSSRTPLR